MPIPNKLPLPQKDALVDALLRCPRMQSPEGRKLVLGDLRDQDIKSINEIDAAGDNKTHIHNIVNTLAKSGDLEGLINRVLYYDGEKKDATQLIRIRLEIGQELFESSDIEKLWKLAKRVNLPASQWQSAFREWSRELAIKQQDDVQDPYNMLLVLASFGRQKLGFPYPALAFLERIAASAPPTVGRELREISEKVAAERDITEILNDFRAGRAWQSLTGTTTLVFEMRPKAEGLALRASLLIPNGTWTVLLTEDTPVSETIAREYFRKLVMRAEQESNQLLIEVVVPREMLCWSVDRWNICVGDYEVPVGGQYPLVVRWLDRLRVQMLEPRWRQKWETVKFHSGQPLWVDSADQFQPRQLLAILGKSPDQGAFVSFAFAPPEKTDGQVDSLSVALNGGTPVALWWRKCDPDPAKAKAELQKVLKHRTLHDLPYVLKEVRNMAEQENDPNHAGYRIALLFDDFDHRPPQLGD
jgi:hypothetical protein